MVRILPADRVVRVCVAGEDVPPLFIAVKVNSYIIFSSKPDIVIEVIEVLSVPEGASVQPPTLL